MFSKFLLVGIGGAAGSMLRYGMTLLMNVLGGAATTATCMVNVIGSFLIGLLASCLEQSNWMLLLTMGLCGGFTTFSTFSMQSVSLLQQGRYGAALLYILGTLILCLSFTILGGYVGIHWKGC